MSQRHISIALVADGKLLVALRIKGKRKTHHKYDLLTEAEVVVAELPPVLTELTPWPGEIIRVHELPPKCKPNGLLRAGEVVAAVGEQAHQYVYALDFAWLQALPTRVGEARDHERTVVHTRVVSNALTRFMENYADSKAEDARLSEIERTRGLTMADIGFVETPPPAKKQRTDEPASGTDGAEPAVDAAKKEDTATAPEPVSS
eukprot:g548.t1